MSNQQHRGLVRAVAMLGALALTPLAVTWPALADDDRHVRNGGFETGALTGWSTSTLTSSVAGWSVHSGTRSPISNFAVPAPPAGRFAAIVDQNGPSSNILYQDLAVDDDDTVLSFDLWYRNRNGDFYSPNTLSARSGLNQQLRIDLLRPKARLRSVRPGAVLDTVIRTAPGDASRLAPTTVRVDLGRFEDRTVRLRIAEVDNQFFFQVGLDRVRLSEADNDDQGSDDHPRPVTLMHDSAVADSAKPSMAPYRR